MEFEQHFILPSSVHPETALRDHFVISEAVVIVVIVIERIRTTDDYDNDNDENLVCRTVS